MSAAAINMKNNLNSEYKTRNSTSNEFRIRSEFRIKRNQMRRRKQLRRRICVALFTSLLIFSLSLLFFGFGSKAQGSDEEIFYKYYKSVTINRGDSLWDYASEYCDNHYDDYQDYINEVMSINCMSEETLIAGCSIIIPYYSPEFVG